MPKKIELPEFLTPGELAKIADVPRQMIFNYLTAGRIQGEHTEEGWRIGRRAAQAWLDARETKARVKYEKIQRQLRGEE